MPKIKKTIFQPTVDINATVKAGPITGPKKEPFNKNELALPFSFLLNHLKIAMVHTKTFSQGGHENAVHRKREK